MTSLFDNLSSMASTDRARFEKIVLKIIDYVMVKVGHDENWQTRILIREVTDRDCETVDCFIDYLNKLKRLVKGEKFLTGYSFLDWAWEQYPHEYNFLKDFIDNFHDFAHGFVKARIIKSDSLMFGLDIGKMIC